MSVCARYFRVPDSVIQALIAEADGEDCGQAGGADSFVPDAAVVEAGSVQREECGALCAGCAELYTLHFADTAVSGSDCASVVAGADSIGR